MELKDDGVLILKCFDVSWSIQGEQSNTIFINLPVHVRTNLHQHQVN